MKKISLMLFLILCLLFLVSCLGQNNPAPSEAEGTSQFANNSWEGIWSCRYNDRDIAQIVIENETDSGFDFTYYATEYKEDDFIHLASFYGTGIKTAANEASIANNIKQLNGEVEELQGRFRLKEDLLEVDYEVLQLVRVADEDPLAERATYQNSFQREPDSAKLSVPFHMAEVRVLGMPLDKQLIPGIEKLGRKPTVTRTPPIATDYSYSLNYDGLILDSVETKEGGYGYIYRITVTDPAISLCRGLCVGDSMDTVLAQFPIFGERMESYHNDLNAQMLYGHSRHMATGGFILMDNGEPASIVFADTGMTITFTLEDKKVTSIVTSGGV
jgi:hypothetical protein